MMARSLVALACGLLFGVGLVVSDMINPARVLAFLDVAGDWDPALAFVMGGALIPSAAAYLYRRKLDTPLLEKRFHVPTNRAIDAPLVGGAVVFGLGWGLVGLCPGPAVAALASGKWQAVVFVLAMIAGMAAHRFMPTLSQKAAA
jgi:uncharacterized membrane protein YedE/YeeE